MDGFKTQPKMCSRHPAQQAVACCMNPECNQNVLLCNKCLQEKHKHPNIKLLKEMPADLAKSVAAFMKKMQEAGHSEISIEQLVQGQRYNIEKEYMQLVENVAKCLEEERRRLFEDFDLLERLSGAEREKTRAVQGRLRSLQYLRQMTDGMLELKMATGSAQGLRELKRHALVLEGLTEEDLRAGESAGRMRAEVGRKVAERLEGSMTRRFNALFTQRIMDRYLSPAAQQQPSSTKNLPPSPMEFKKPQSVVKKMPRMRSFDMQKPNPNGMERQRSIENAMRAVSNSKNKN